MVIIADTSPLNYLVLIGHVEVLPKLYGGVVIPRSVLLELQHSSAPPAVARWIAAPPAWLSVAHDVPSLSNTREDLDPGERDAIALAEASLPDVLLLIDEDKGAKRRNGAASRPPAHLLFWMRPRARACSIWPRRSETYAEPTSWWQKSS